MMKVGEFIGDSNKKLNYRSVKKDYCGWVDAKKYLPADFDLMFLKVKGKDYTHGWIQGNKWDGLRIEDGDEVLYWKRKE